MDFASPVAASIAGKQVDSRSTGKTFATWTFNKAKHFAAQRRAFMQSTGPCWGPSTAARGYREEHHPSAVGEGLLP